MKTKGKLFLIPSPLSEHTQDQVISDFVRSKIEPLKYFLTENVRTSRRYLSSLKLFSSIEALQFEVLDKDTTAAHIPALMEPLLLGHDAGLMSESGCPGIADPGALAVKYAHDHQIQVVPLVGPSSIILGLMSSGLDGQRFAFHGYLPVDTTELTHTIKSLEKESKLKHQTQLFIETPYRNSSLLKKLTQILSPDTLLCIAIDLTGEQEQVSTRTIREWKKMNLQLPKVPALFLFLCP